MDNLVLSGILDLFSHPYPPEPSPRVAIKSPIPVPHPISNLNSTPIITHIPFSSSSPVYVGSVSMDKSPFSNNHHVTSHTDKSVLKGKALVILVTPPNLPISFPTNSIGSDLDLLLQRELLLLHPLTIHKPRKFSSPVISPTLAGNITVRRKQNRGSRHFRERKDMSKIDLQESSLVDIPISNLVASGPLRASMPGDRAS